jgi:hypothetical protein
VHQLLGRLHDVRQIRDVERVCSPSTSRPAAAVADGCTSSPASRRRRSSNGFSSTSAAMPSSSIRRIRAARRPSANGRSERRATPSTARSTVPYGRVCLAPGGRPQFWLQGENSQARTTSARAGSAVTMGSTEPPTRHPSRPHAHFGTPQLTYKLSASAAVRIEGQYRTQINSRGAKSL